MAINYARARRVATRMIRRWGAPASLQRDGVKRPCVAAITDFSPSERRGKLIDPTDQLVVLSIASGIEPPDRELDVLITYLPNTTTVDKELRINAPPGMLAPAGVVVFYELQVSA